MPDVIVMGDATDHGGTVIEASGVTETHGRNIARVGDKVQCPKKGHGLTVIVSGDATFVVDGAPVAYHGCKTSCGATLIASQAVTTVVQGGGGAPGAMHSAASEVDTMRTPVPPAAPAPGYNIHFLVQDDRTGQPLPNVPYRLTLANGDEFTGLTDIQGLTCVVSSHVPTSAEIEVPYHGHSEHRSHAHDEHETCGC